MSAIVLTVRASLRAQWLHACSRNHKSREGVMIMDLGISDLQADSDRLSNTRLLSRLQMLCQSSRRTEFEIIRLLVILHARHLSLPGAYSSLYDFCARRLGMTESEAARRVAAARLIRRVPVLLESLKNGKLSMTTLLCLRDYITAENAEELLGKVSSKSKREVEMILATRAPHAGVRSRRRHRPVNGLPEYEVMNRLTPIEGVAPESPPTGSSPAGSQSPRYRLQVETTHVLREKIELARSLMKRGDSSEDLAAVIEAGVDALLRELRAPAGVAGPSMRGAGTRSARETRATSAEKVRVVAISPRARAPVTRGARAHRRVARARQEVVVRSGEASRRERSAASPSKISAALRRNAVGHSEIERGRRESRNSDAARVKGRRGAAGGDPS